MTFNTGNGKWDGSRTVKVFNNGAWTSIPSSCTNKGSRCHYTLCSTELKIKVGNDGWKTTVTSGVNTVSEVPQFLKNQEVTFLIARLPEAEVPKGIA